MQQWMMSLYAPKNSTKNQPPIILLLIIVMIIMIEVEISRIGHINTRHPESKQSKIVATVF